MTYLSERAYEEQGANGKAKIKKDMCHVLPC